MAPNDRGTTEPIKLDARLIDITRVSAMLSALAYEENAAENYSRGKSDRYEHPDLDYIQFYINDPDQAIVARQGGRCYISFRGTVLPTKESLGFFFNDWEQNFDLGNRIIHRNNDPSQPACEGRRGYADFIDTQEAKEGLEDVVRCMDDCSDQEDCLVVTGHSQGGATATIASVLLYDWQPTVVTFGQPPAVDPGCELIPSERFYRYINSKVEDNNVDLSLDGVPFVPTIVSGSAHYGHALLLGADVDGGSAIKYLGFNEIDFEPALVDLDIYAHTMAATSDADYSYEARINAIVDTFKDSDNIDIETVGFSDGAVCEYGELCKSGGCKDNVCTSGANTAIVVGGVVGGVTVLMLLLLLVMKVRKRRRSSAASKESPSTSPTNTSSSTSSPRSDASPKSSSGRVQREIMAPSGKLGIVVGNTTKHGPAVHTIRPGSPMEGLVYLNDIIVGVNDIDTRKFTAKEITQVMKDTVGEERNITVLSLHQ